MCLVPDSSFFPGVDEPYFQVQLTVLQALSRKIDPDVAEYLRNNVDILAKVFEQASGDKERCRFLMAVILALPRNIAPNVIEGWTTNRKLLEGTLERALNQWEKPVPIIAGRLGDKEEAETLLKERGTNQLD